MKRESILVRCLSKEHCEQTLNGELYMNSIHYFLSNGNMSQSDYFEGMAYMLPISSLPFSVDFKNAFSDEYIYGLPIGFKYIHVYCFSKIETVKDGITKRFKCPSDEQFKDFGDRCLVIKDPNSFFERVINKCNELGYKVFIKEVSYRDTPSRGNALFELENTDDLYVNEDIKITPFIKGKDHESEMEYRILVLPDQNIGGPLKLNIGSIRDIAYVRRLKMNNGLSIQNDSKKNNIQSILSDLVLSNCKLDEMLKEAIQRESWEGAQFFKNSSKEQIECIFSASAASVTKTDAA